MKYPVMTLLALAVALQAAWAQNSTPVPSMQRYIIERDIPGASQMSTDEKRAGAAKSNAVLHDMGPDIQWVQSFVAGDKVYCVYQATSVDLIREHARRSGFPASKITPIAAVIDPTTANPAR
jgi:hypothetical protein